MKSKMYLVIFLSVACLLLIFFVYKYNWFQKNPSSQNEMCIELKKIIEASDHDFENIKGKIRDDDSEPKSCKLYDCTIKLPNSTDNNIEYCDSTAPSFATTLFHGQDSVYAYNTYLTFVFSFLQCFPEWKYADKKDYDTMDAEIYSVYVYKNHILYVLFDRAEEKDFYIDLILSNE